MPASVSRRCSTGFVRPEGCRGSHRPGDPQGSMMECPVREPCPPKCCYPDMRRSNPTCEAPGTTASIWEHQPGGGLAEDGRLNASERPWLRSVIENRPKVLTGRSQNGMRVGSSSGTLDDGGNTTRRGVVQNLPFLGHTGVRRPPACEGRITTGGVSFAGGGRPPHGQGCWG